MQTLHGIHINHTDVIDSNLCDITNTLFKEYEHFGKIRKCIHRITNL